MSTLHFLIPMLYNDDTISTRKKMLRQYATRVGSKRTIPIVKNVPHLRRTYATEPTSSTSTSRIAWIEARLPRFLQRLVTPIRHAPVSHVTAFLILHEVTAVVPLVGLAAAFHYANWMPPYLSEGKWFSEGTEKFGRWMRKRGWITEQKRSGRWWGRGEGGMKILVELATAYAITKALLPLRVLVSIWATPWFAKWTTLPLLNKMRRTIWRKKSANTTASAAAGTGAVGASTLPKEAGPKPK